MYLFGECAGTVYQEFRIINIIIFQTTKYPQFYPAAETKLVPSKTHTAEQNSAKNHQPPLFYHKGTATSNFTNMKDYLRGLRKSEDV